MIKEFVVNTLVEKVGTTRTAIQIIRIRKNKTKVQFEEQGFGNDIENEDVEEINKRITRSMTDVKREEMRKEEISTFWMKMENLECFDEMTIYTVVVPVREHKKPEIIEAKQKEIENLEKYGVFEEVEDEE